MPQTKHWYKIPVSPVAIAEFVFTIKPTQANPILLSQIWRLISHHCYWLSIIRTAIITSSLAPSGPLIADDLKVWLTSEAREQLIAEFEENDCRLTLTEISDILFEYDASEEYMYTERLIRMEPEQKTLVFPVVLVKGAACKDTNVTPITIPEAAIEHAIKLLVKNTCVMDVAALESVAYPETSGYQLVATDRRNLVSELYNRAEITFRYVTDNGLQKLRAHKLTGCGG